MSIHHGAHQSAIEYNELLDRFEEVPVDADGNYFRGSFPNEESAGANGFDIPQFQHNSNQMPLGNNISNQLGKKPAAKNTLSTKRSLSKDPESSPYYKEVGGQNGANLHGNSGDANRPTSPEELHDSDHQKPSHLAAQYKSTK